MGRPCADRLGLEFMLLGKVCLSGLEAAGGRGVAHRAGALYAAAPPLTFSPI